MGALSDMRPMERDRLLHVIFETAQDTAPDIDVQLKRLAVQLSGCGEKTCRELVFKLWAWLRINDYEYLLLGDGDEDQELL
jgi:hypothetical protein